MDMWEFLTSKVNKDLKILIYLFFLIYINENVFIGI